MQRAFESDIQRVMDRVEAILPPCPSEQVEVDRLRHFERVTSFLLRYGSRRGDPVHSMLAHVGNYWCSAVLVVLQGGPLRPSAVQKRLSTFSPHQPISQRMLTLNLRTLEADGLIEREVCNSKNPHVEYRLTRMGREYSKLLLSIIEWAGENFQEIVAARERYEPPSAPMSGRGSAAHRRFTDRPGRRT